MPTSKNPETKPNYPLRRAVAATLIAFTGGIITHEVFSDDTDSTPNTPQVTRTCSGVREVHTLTHGGLYGIAIQIYPENPHEGVTAIIEANPQKRITDPNVIQPGEYIIPNCTLDITQTPNQQG